MKQVLYDIERDNGDRFILRAYEDPFTCGLVLEGQDFCALAERLFGDEEYEYYYCFSKEDTEKLAKALGNADLPAALTEFFHGEMRDAEFFGFCKQNGIKWDSFYR